MGFAVEDAVVGAVAEVRVAVSLNDDPGAITGER